MKIGLCGTMSVGKTTLVNALQELPEFKDYMFRTERSKELMSQGIPLNTDSTLKGQCVFLAERAGELMQDNIITDRTVIDVMAFSNCSLSMDIYDKEDFETLASRLVREYDYIFYVSPEGVEIEDNGIRETDAQYRKNINFMIKGLLTKYRHKVKNLNELSGSTEERIKQMKQTLSL
jgi:nicotinamide riboside kinase|tara:strand:+ start:315 stop:845 length:531 start_codon:yes stop_codon:yes gene_type:complete